MQNQAMAEQLLHKSIELTQDWLVEFKKPNWDDFENGIRGDKAE